MNNITVHPNTDKQMVPLNELKVMLIGDDGPFKRRISEQLRRGESGAVDPDASRHTPGNSVVTAERSYRISGREVLLHIWDISGRDLERSVASIFLTERTVYVVAAAGEQKVERARHWLRRLRKMAGSCPVLLIMEGMKSADESEGENLIGTYPNLRGVLRVSERDTAYGDTVRRSLVDVIEKHAVTDIPIPPAWDHIRSELNTIRTPYMLPESFKAILRACGEQSAEQVDAMMRCFRDAGVIAYYDGSADSLVALNPAWILDSVERILIGTYNMSAPGQVSHQQIGQRWKGDTGDTRTAYFLNILRKNGMSFAVDTNLEFIPCCANGLPLPIEREYKREYKRAPGVIALYMEYEFLVENILHRLMVQLRQELNLEQVWSQGALFEQRGNGFSALVTEDGSVISIFVRGTNSRYQPQTYLNHIMDAVKEVHNQMGLLMPDPMIAYKHEGKTEYFDYSMLERMQEEGYHAVYSRNLRRMIPIEDILGVSNQRVEKTRKQLLKDLAEAFVNMQGNRLMWSADGGSRSSVLRDILKMKGYRVSDQRSGGMFSRMTEEMDLLIGREDEKLALCASMKSGSIPDLRNWNRNLERILSQSRSSGHPVLFLLNYVECERQEYHSLWNTYNKHIRSHDPEFYPQIGDYEHVYPLTEQPEFLRMARCSYNTGGMAVMVYHCFVYMGGNVEQAEAGHTLEAMRLSQLTQQTEELSRALAEEKHARMTAEQGIHRLKEQLDKERSDADSRSQEIAVLQAKIRQNDAAQADTGAGKRRLQQEVKRLEAECRSLKDAADRAQRMAKEAAAAESAARVALDDMQQKAGDAEQRCSTLQARVKQLSEILQGLEKRHAAETGEWPAAAAAQKQMIEALNLELAATRAEAAKTAAERNTLMESLAEARSREQTAETLASEAQEEYIRAAEETARKAAQIEQLKMELQMVREELEAARKAEQEQTEEEDPEEDCDDSDVNTEYRVVIMGDSEAGKSQILYRLRHPNGDPRKYDGEITQGIDIFTKCYPIGKHRVRINFWDFGGQEILYSMHRMFMSKNTMYVIVLNTRNDNQDEQALFWLRYVQIYAAGSPVILVLNKIDQNPTASLNIPLLRREFRDMVFVEDVLRISAREDSADTFREMFTKQIFRQIEKSLQDAHSFSDQELRICSRVRQQSGVKPSISLDNFRDICNAEHLDGEKAQKELARRFHTAGMMVYFGTRTKLLMDPRWITDAIYKVVACRECFDRTGIVRLETLESELRKASGGKLKKTHVDFLVKIMRKYGLSFRYRDQRPGDDDSREQEFIPMLCRRDEPEEIESFLEQPGTIQMQLNFKYLPASLLYQLMVDYWHTLDAQNVWLSGAMFREEKYTTVLRRERNLLTIYIRTEEQGSMRQSLEALISLRKHIQDLTIEEMYNTSIQETMIGYWVSGKVEMFDYERLQLAKEQAKSPEYVMSKYKHGKVAVEDILDQTDRSEQRTIDELLKLTMRGCMALQMNQTFWFPKKTALKSGGTPKMDENARNRLLKVHLEKAFLVYDQTQAGEAASGISPGELDLLVQIDKDTPLSILEALNIYGDSDTSQQNWVEHLCRMALNYNKNGLRCLLLVSYLNLPKKKEYSEMETVYSKLLRDTEVGQYGKPVCETVQLDNCPENIHIMRAEYPGLTVYHYLVLIPEYSGESKTKADAAKGKEKSLAK